LISLDKIKHCFRLHLFTHTSHSYKRQNGWKSVVRSLSPLFMTKLTDKWWTTNFYWLWNIIIRI